MSDDIAREEWEIDGTGRMTDKQRKMLNAVCGDLAKFISWHGHWLTKDDWRHLLSGTVKGWRTFMGVNRGEGAPGIVMLGASSLSLSRTLAAEAIRTGVDIGDKPDEQGLRFKRVRWSDAVYRGLGFDPRDFA
jgi:hypothetical protein